MKYSKILNIISFLAILLYSSISFSSGMSAISVSGKFLKARTSISITSGGTQFDTNIVIPYGRLTRYILEIPDYTNDSTTTLSIIDTNSVVIYQSPSYNDNSNYSIPVDIELSGSYTVRLTLNTAPGNDTTVYLSFLGF